MESLTKPRLSPAEIAALVAGAFGSGARVVAATAADAGWYNAGWKLRLEGSGPARAFLKVGPAPDIPVLTYEHRLMRAEAATLEALAGAGAQSVPAVLAEDFSGRIVAGDALFMAWADGILLGEAREAMSADERVRVRRDVARVCGLAHRIEGPVFGYPGQRRLQAMSWAEAFALMWRALLDDAARFEPALPAPAEAIAEAFERAGALLEGAFRPRLTHFDLWDLNVLVRQSDDGWELSAVIDWERGFWGDPLADVFALTVTGDAAERAAVLEGLAEGRGAAHAMDGADERRLALYRAYLWLIMLVEAPSRGFAGSIRSPASSAGRRLMRDLAITAG